MTIELHQRARSRMAEQLAEILLNISIHDGCFVTARSLLPLVALDRTLPTNTPEIRILHSYIDDEPAYHFFSEYINLTVSREMKYASGQNFNLNKVPYFNDVESASRHLVSELTTLPWKYLIYYNLWGDAAQLMPPDLDEFVLSDNTRLIRVSAENIHNFPKPPNNVVDGSLASMFGLFGHSADEISIGRVAFVTEAEGFIGRYAISEPLRRAESRLRAFLGLCLATGVLSSGNSYMPSPPKQRLLIQRLDNESDEIERTDELDDDFNRAITKLEPLKLGPGHDQKASDFVKHYQLELMRAAFKDTQTGRQIQLAARWHFDSNANSGELLSFIQAMVCLEIVLGDQNEASENGLGETIRNRCAYLIGKSIEDRQRIIEDIKNIYRVRSKIVHTGKDSLSGKERIMMFRLRQICSQVLQAELEVAAKT